MAERVRELTDELAKKDRELLSMQARLDRILRNPLLRLYGRLRRLPGMQPLVAWRARRHWHEVAAMEPASSSDPAPTRTVVASDTDDFEERITWIFGTPRSGSTWFLKLIGSHPDVVPMHEPWLGHHLAPFTLYMHHPEVSGDFFSWMRQTFRDDADYFFSMQFSDRWRPLLRDMILTRLQEHVGYAKPLRRASDPEVRMVIREPNASWAAETIMALLPRSRMIFLVRDGRDVLDSLVDGYQAGGWLSESTPKFTVTPERRRYFMESHAASWVQTMDAVGRAFEAHRPEDRLLVRYEELLDDTAGGLAGVLRWLGVQSSPQHIEDIVPRHAFSAGPETDRGRGRPKRAAMPGLWRENFTAEEQARVEEIMGSKLLQLGYVEASSRS